jgi:hypothetical protein
MAQPHMGQRKLYATRPPEDVASGLERESAETGLSYSQLLADIIAARYGLPLPSERFRTKRSLRTAGQGALPGPELQRVVTPAAPRAHYSTRLPVDVATRFEAEAGPTGIGYSLFLADVLADRYQLPLPSKRQQSKQDRVASGQSALPIDGPAEEVSRLERAS